MNDKFFNLPIEKQQRIINAAFKVFSRNDYRKAPMLEIKRCIQKDYSEISDKSENKVIELLDSKDFCEGIDLKLMYREILMAVDGYMFQKYRTGNIDPDEIERDFYTLINHWKKIYLKRS